MRRSLFICALLLGACSGGSSDSPVLTFADFASPPTSSEVLSETPTTTRQLDVAEPDETTTSTSTTSTTLIVIDAPGPVAILTEDGFSTLEGRGAPRRVVDRAVAAAFEDLEGGMVFQLPGAGVDASADQRIFWSRPGRPAAEPFLDVTEGSLLRLWGTELIDGTPHLIMTITDDPGDPDERVERLVVHDFSGDRVLAEVGGDGSGPVAVDYGGGRFLLEQRAGELGFFEFRNDQGAVITLASNPQTGCADGEGCARMPAIEQSGSAAAYIDGEAELVVLDLELGDEITRIPLPGSLGEVIGLDFAESTVLINRVDPAGAERALIIDVAGGTVGEFGLTGRVHFLREPPTYDGTLTINDQ